MLSSFPPTTYVAVPFNVVQSREKQPMLGNNPNAKSYHGSKDKGSSYFFWLITKLASILGLSVIVLSIIWISLVLFDDKPTREIYQTTSFLTSVDSSSTDSWQVLSQSWSDLSKPHPTIDVQFNHYFECWYAAGIKFDVCSNSTEADYKACIEAKFPTQLQTCVNSSNPNTITPSLNEYTTCINNAFLPDRRGLNALKICLRTNMWPLYQSPETVDSWNFLGSFNWAVFLTMGFGLFSCYALYTGGFVMKAEDLDVHNLHTSKNDGPLSMGVTLVCVVISALLFIYFLIISYRLPVSTGSTYVFPNSVGTNTVMIPATFVVLAYFLMELLEMKYGTSKHSQRLEEPKQESGLNAFLQGRGNIPYHMTGKEGEWATVMNQYYPALTLTWADGYLLDPIMAIGILGLTHQCSTAVLYQVFLAIFTYRFAHTAVARFMYEGYIYNPDEADGKFEKKDGHINSELYAIRMQAMFMHLSAVSAVFMLYYILTNDNDAISEHSFVFYMLYLWYIIPEIIRLVAHVIVAFKAISAADKYVLLGTNYFIWVWDIIVRFIFICIIFWGANTITGTQSFLLARHHSIFAMIDFMS